MVRVAEVQAPVTGIRPRILLAPVLGVPRVHVPVPEIATVGADEMPRILCTVSLPAAFIPHVPAPFWTESEPFLPSDTQLLQAAVALEPITVM